MALMRNPKTAASVRVAAANAILDRGYGKPQVALGDGDNKVIGLEALIRASMAD